jgi:4-hydroxyphenylpyruvate dioxygenase
MSAPNSINAGMAVACGFAIGFTKPVPEVLDAVLRNGGEAVTHKADSKAVDAPVIKGIGDCMLYLIDRNRRDLYADFTPIAGVDQNPAGFGLTFIDHLTHNLYLGNMAKWSDYYERLFNFREIRYFDIKGAKTGLLSKAMTAPGRHGAHPAQRVERPKSQINEYLDAYNGEGIQHIACFTDDIYDHGRSDARGRRGIPRHAGHLFRRDRPAHPNHGEDVPRLRANKILIDADPETKQRKLLQIFTQNALGPIFFEIIQRKGNEGFGEGNFQALFESIERDQMRRGVL